jgi:peptide chain release factor subunit 1
MINRKQIVDLLRFHSETDFVLSFYMGIGVYRSNKKGYGIEAKDLLKQAIKGADLSRDEREKVEAGAGRILNFLNMDFQGKAKGLAIFACEPAGLWQVFMLPASVPDRCVIDRTPFVVPMLKLVDEGRRYCVVVVDKEKARVFTIYNGELFERTDIFDEVPGWHKQGGWAQARFQRHIEDLVNRHLKHVADTVFRFYKMEGFGHLVIGGTQEMQTRFYRIIHSYLQRIVAGYITVDVPSNINDVLSAVRGVEAEAERKRSTEIVNALTGSSKNHITVTGLKETVKALEEGRVHTLVLIDNHEVEGCLCSDCGGVDVLGADECGRCKNKIGKVGDVSEHLAVLAVEHDGEVNYVLPGSGLEKADGVGAVLRW